MFRLGALVIDVYLQSVSVISALYVFGHDMFECSFVCLVLSTHEVSVIQMMLASGIFVVACRLIKLFELISYFSVNISVSVAIVYQKLFYSCEFLVHCFICGTGAGGSSNKCTDDTGFVAGWTFAVCIECLSCIGGFSVNTGDKPVVSLFHNNVKEGNGVVFTELICEPKY